MINKITQENYNIQTYNVHGLKVSVFDDIDLSNYIVAVINQSNKIICYGYSFGSIPFFKEYPQMAKYPNTFDISVCDGRWFFWFCKFRGYKMKSALSIPDMVQLVLNLANRNKYSVMILGSTVDNNNLATNNLKRLYPDVNVLEGYDGGFFTEQDCIKSVEIINQRKPDILLIGVSLPKKESFAYNYKKQLRTKVIIPFGGYVDILSGKSMKMPTVIKKLGLAFLYRFIQEPRRFFKDGILNPLESILILLPHVIFWGNKFSFPKYYHKSEDFPIL